MDTILLAPSLALSAATTTGLIIGIIVVIIVVFLIFFTNKTEKADRAAALQTPAAPAAPKAPDDLVIIEGIGPKIASLLKAAGITTFAELASTDVNKLRSILDSAGLARLADPSTWGRQAKLAAEGKLDELKALQDSLKGGRQ